MLTINEKIQLGIDSIFEDLDECEVYYLKEELKQLNYRTTSELRAAAKKKALKHKVQEMYEEGILTLKIAAFVSAIVAIVIVNYSPLS